MRLKTFGGLSLESDVEDKLGPAAIRRRPLALLAVLAASGDRPVSRERLCALFWPESDSDRARNSLNQTLFALRRDLGNSDLLLGSTDLRLNPSCIRSDVGAFESAIKADRLDEAVSHYSGAFLDGIHLKECPKEFEEWVDNERARLATDACDALSALATDATTRGQHDVAVGFWRRLATLRPTDSRAAVQLMRALAASGNSMAALEYARVHEAYLRTQFDIPVDPEIVGLTAKLSAAMTPGSSRDSSTGDVLTTLASAFTAADSSLSQPAPSGRPTSPQPGVSSARRSRSFHWPARRTVTAIVIIALAAFSTARTPVWGSGRHEADPALVAILPFTVRGDSAASYLREGMVDLLSTDLDDAGDIHTVDPHVLLATESRTATDGDLGSARDAARRLGAGLFVVGDVAQSGGRLRLSASLYSQAQGDRAVTRVTAEGSADSLFQLTSILTRRLLVGRTPATDVLTSLAATQTTSLDALKAYLKGRRAMRRFRNAEAVEAFQLAEGLDSTFALAPYALSAAADWASQGDLARLAADRAVRFGTSLPSRAKWLLHASAAWRRGDADQAESALRRILEHHPDDVEARNMLAEVLFHLNAARGRPALEARPEFERVLQLYPDNYEAILHLGRLAAFQGERDRLAQLNRTMSRARPGGADETRILYAARFQSPAEQAALFDSIAPGTSISVAVLCWRIAVYTRRPQRAEPICRKLTEADHDAEWRAVGYRRLAELAVATGRFREASSHIAALSVLVPEQAKELAAWISVMPNGPPAAFRSTAFADLSSMQRHSPDRVTETFAPFNGKHGLIRDYLLRILSSRNADMQHMEAAELGVDEMKTAGSASVTLARNFDRALRADVAARDGHVTDALSFLAQNVGERSSAGDRWFGEELLTRYHRGQLLTRLGRYDEALHWFTSFTDPYVEDLMMEAPGELASARLELQRGNTSKAAEHYRRFHDRWRDADPELQPLVAEARLHADAAAAGALRH